MHKAIFWDRDDTLVYDVPYNGDPSRVKLLPNTVKALTLLHTFNFKQFIITNQSGVGRGIITKDQVLSVNKRLLELLGTNLIQGIYCCYDDPANPLENCRKPSPQMIYKARDEHNLSLSSSFVIGDKIADIQAGHSANCRSILKLIDYKNADQAKAKLEADYASTNLLKIAEWIINFETSN